MHCILIFNMHDTEKQNFPKRKHPRLKEYDYSLNGYYFVTICSKNMRHIFGKVEPSSVGRGLAPAAQIVPERKVYLSQCGLIARQELLALESRYAFVRIDKFVIMPNHIHAIIVLDGETAGASPRPTLSDIVCTFKSLTTRACNALSEQQGSSVFQTSFYDKIIRNEEGYLSAWQYIDENPRKWQNDEYYK